jgi:hypothetical protein
MENLDLLTNLGKIAGIGGIAVGAAFLIFRGLIQKNIFPNLTKEHAFRIIRMIVYSCTIIAVVGILAWVYGGKNQSKSALSTVRASGYVVDQNGNGLGNVFVKVKEIEGLGDVTDSDGKYIINFNGTSNADYTLFYERSGYQIKAKKVPIDFTKENESVDQVTLAAVENIEISDEADAPKNTGTRQADVKTDITLIYAGDSFGCTLDLVISVGGKAIRPTSNTITMNDLALGETEYKITRGITCMQLGSCVALGSGSLNITKNAVYYLIWNNDGYSNECSVTLITQDEFTQFYGL